MRSEDRIEIKLDLKSVLIRPLFEAWLVEADSRIGWLGSDCSQDRAATFGSGDGCDRGDVEVEKEVER